MTEVMKNKVAFAFNIFLLDLIKDIKSIADTDSAGIDGVMREIRSHYKVFDKGAISHIECFRQNLAETEDDEDVHMLKGCSFKTLKDMFGTNAGNEGVLKSYLIVFKILAILYEDVESDPSAYTIDSLNLVIHKIKSVKSDTVNDGGDNSGDNGGDNSGDNGGDNGDAFEILDDRISKLLLELDSNRVALENLENDSSVEMPTVSQDTMKSFFDNSTIGSLAKEISKEINMDALKGTDPSQILNATFNATANDIDDPSAGASTNVLGSVVSKVSSKIHERIASGSLKQEDLISEAMSLMGMLNNGGLGGLGGNFGSMLSPDMLTNIGNMLKTVDPLSASPRPKHQKTKE